MDSLRGLQQILTLAECGTYRKAAKKLGITHSALSQTVSKLEEELGATLFIRNHRETVPTAFGLRLLNAATTALDEIDEARRDITLMRKLGAGRMVIGADPTLSESLLAPGLADMMRRYPRLRFTVLSRNWLSMEEDLRAKRIDMFIGLAPDRKADGIIYQELQLKPPVLAFRKGHPIELLDEPDVSDYLDWPVIGSEAPDWFLEYFRAVYPEAFPNLQSLRSLFLTTQSLSLLRRLLLSSDALAMVPLALVRDDVEAGRIGTMEVHEQLFPDYLPGVIATLEGRPEPPAAAELTKLIHETLGASP